MSVSALPVKPYTGPPHGHTATVVLAGICLLLCTVSVTTAVERLRVNASAVHTRLAPGEAAVVHIRIQSPKKLSSFPALQVPRDDAFNVVNRTRDQSHRSSISIVNGRMHKDVTAEYVYSLVVSPRRDTTFTFPACEVTIDDSTYTTKPVTIQVGQSQAGRGNTSATTKDRGTSVDGAGDGPGDGAGGAGAHAPLRAHLRISDTRPYTSEQVILTFRLLQDRDARVRVGNEEYISCMQNIEEALREHFSLVRLTPRQQLGKGVPKNVDGKTWYVFTIRFAAFALHEGTVRIPSIPMQYVKLKDVSRGRRSRDPFDDFFGGFFGSSAVRKVPAVVRTNSLTVQVQPRPQAPDGFSGCVAPLELESKISRDTLTQGQDATVTITASARTRAGNMPQISLEAPEGVDVYEPEVHTYVDTTDNGLYTKVVYTFLSVFTQPGQITIPALSLPYFDAQKGTYARARSRPFVVQVRPGKGGASSTAGARVHSQSEIRRRAEDIRYIHTGVRIRAQTGRPYTKAHFILLYALALGSAVLAWGWKKGVHRYVQRVFLHRRQAYSTARRDLQRIKTRAAQMSLQDAAQRCASIIEHYIDRTTGVRAAGLTREALQERLMQQRLDKERAQDVAAFLQHCDACSYGFAPQEEHVEDLVGRARTLLHALRHLGRKERRA